VSILTAWRPALLCGAMMSFLLGNLAADQSDSGLTAKAADNRPDLMVTLKSTALLSPLQDVTITVTVINNGAGPAPKSDCDVFVRNGHAPRQTVKTLRKAIRALEPGDHYTFSFAIRLNLGLFEIAATVDRKKKIPETDEKNNKARIMIEGK
jgi:subtilase family serine protease